MTKAPATTKEEKQQKAHRSPAFSQGTGCLQIPGTWDPPPPKTNPTAAPLHTFVQFHLFVPGLSVSLGFRVTADAVKLTVSLMLGS